MKQSEYVRDRCDGEGIMARIKSWFYSRRLRFLPSWGPSLSFPTQRISPFAFVLTLVGVLTWPAREASLVQHYFFYQELCFSVLCQACIPWKTEEVREGDRKLTREVCALCISHRERNKEKDISNSSHRVVTEKSQMFGRPVLGM